MVQAIMAALGLLLSTALAFNSTVAEGTEVFITNTSGSVIWGYGVVRGGVLELSMSQSVGEFLLIVVPLEGEVRAWPGRLAGGEIELVFESGERVGLVELLTALSLRLSVGPGQVRAAEGGADRQEFLPSGENGVRHAANPIMVNGGEEAKSGENVGAD